MKFNINQNVYVRLTPLGHKILREQHEQLCRDVPAYKRPYFEPNVDKDGYTRFQMHYLMECFGSHVGLGFELPFETDIRFDDRDLMLLEPEMTHPQEIVINTENWSDEHKQRVIELLSSTAAVYSSITPSEPAPIKAENCFKHFDLDDKLKTLDSLASAFKAAQYSSVGLEIERKINELLESLQE